MELPLITDVAARQVIDSTKAFKEYVRVRDELKDLGSSIRWKSVKGYEYLVQRDGHRLDYLGKRSPETEQKYREDVEKRKRLEARFKSLSGIVETSERMNKAVRAGAVPTELMDVLRKLDELGLADRSVLLGTPALYAYGQSSGLRVDAIKTPTKGESLVSGPPKCVHVLIEDPDSLASTSFQRFTQAMKRVASVERADLKGERGCILDIVLVLPEKKGVEMFSAKTPKKPTTTVGKSSEPWLDVIKAAPKYEQVVIGKTGKMASMRTVDPRLFTAIFHCTNASEQASPEVRGHEASQIELVETMLKEHMVRSKIAPEERVLFEKQIAEASLSGPVHSSVVLGS